MTIELIGPHRSNEAVNKHAINRLFCAAALPSLPVRFVAKGSIEEAQQLVFRITERLVVYYRKKIPVMGPTKPLEHCRVFCSDLRGLRDGVATSV